MLNKKINTFTLILIAFLKISYCNASEICFPADSCHTKGVDLYLQGKYIESLTYSKEAAKLRSKNNDILLWKSYRNIGLAYFQMDFYNEAIKYFLKAYQTKGNQTEKDLVQLLRNIGEYYSDLGDLGNAIEYGRKAIQMNPEDPEALVTYAMILNTTKDSIKISEAIQYAESAIQLCKENENDKHIRVLGRANVTKGNSLNLLSRFDEASQHYENALKLKSDTSHQFRILNNIATVFFYKNKHISAIQKLKESLSLLSQYQKTEYSYYYTFTFENLADNYVKLEQFDTAFYYYQKALINLTNNFRTENIFQNPNPKDTSLFIYSNLDMIRVLDLKATAAYKYYQQNNNIKYLNLANQTYQTAFDFHDNLQKEISTENSRLFQVKNIVPYIENALRVAYEQQKNGQTVGKAAFRFMEKNKATVLLQSMNEADALQFANLPDSLLEQEKDLKMALTFHNKQLNETEETLEIERLNNILFEEKQQYTQLINHLEKNYPDYYRLKYQQNQTQLTDVQNTLNDKTALLEYFIGDSSIYVLSIQKEHSKLYQVKKPANWKTTIDSFRYSITDIHRDKPMLFVETSQQLYEWHLSEPLCDLQNEITQLQIIPDAELNYVPFEILLTENVDKNNIQYKKLPYLLKSKSVGYAYSAALLLENMEIATLSKTFAYGGYAPIYENKNYANLYTTKLTVQDLANALNGKAYIGKEATLTNFINDPKSYNILHLSMHGVLKDKKPLSSYMAFYPTNPYKLFASDLYNMQINTDLTILHACNTGIGELQKGEGVMSLSRAFTYAGCPSLVMSLWQIPEKATSEITSLFIKHLQTGLTKDVALQQAKLNYIQNENIPERLALPAYWAGLVAAGNLNAIDFD